LGIPLALALKFVFFFIKVFLPLLSNYKHTSSPRPNGNGDQPCNSNILKMVSE